MIVTRPSFIELTECFFLGLSSLIGTEQFYMVFSQSGNFLRTQYFILVATVILTLGFLVTVFDDENPEFFNVIHLVHTALLGFLYFYIKNRVTSKVAAILLTFFIGFILTLLVVHGCIYYSHSRFLLLTFLLGLYSARLFPTFCWSLLKAVKPDYLSQLNHLTETLCLVRLSLSVISIIIKTVTSKFTFTKIPKSSYRFGVHEGLVEMYENFRQFPCSAIPFVPAFASAIVFLVLSPIATTSSRRSTYFLFSHNLTLNLSNFLSLFHLLGCCFGMVFPLSATSRTLKFYLNNIFTYIPYIIAGLFVYYSDKPFNYHFLYCIELVAGLLLGYNWMYSLSNIINTTLFQTCKYEDHCFKPCCGERMMSQCYCKFPQIAESLKPPADPHSETEVEDKKRFECSTLLSSGGKSLKYDKDGKKAVLILYDADNPEDCTKFQCSESSCDQCCRGKDGCCLKLISIYQLDSITTTNCDQCQLTVRLEAKKICICKCGSAGGATCSCVLPDCSKCCCLCVGCGDTTCRCNSENCSCIRLCNKTEAGCHCNSRDDDSQGTRVFLCYKNNGGKYCIREIMPNTTPEFDGDLTKQTDFYLRSIFLSDCCHTDLQVDLHCVMKNNFFRPMGITYPNKYNKPAMLALSNKDSEVCGCKDSHCCCGKIPFVKITSIYESPKEGLVKTCQCPASATCACGCCAKGKCCCSSVCELNISQKTSFFKRKERQRVKLIVVLWTLFVLLTLLTRSIVSGVKIRRMRQYEFRPLIAFEEILKKTKTDRFNKTKRVEDRISAVLNDNTLDRETMLSEKRIELADMYELFENVVNPEEFQTLKGYVESNSNELYLSPEFEHKGVGVELVQWSYCLGLMYSYVITMFYETQRFFARWEYVWQREYHNQKKMMDTLINKILLKSKFANSLTSEVRREQRSLLFIKRQRAVAWNEAYLKTDKNIELYAKELKTLRVKLPESIDHRIHFYLNRWEHRVQFIGIWEKEMTNTIDWSKFMDEVRNLNSWMDYFGPYVKMAFTDNEIKVKELNKNTDVFVKSKID